MRKTFILLACLPLVSLSLGCQNTKTHAVEGGVIGGVLGAAAGGIIGHQSHSGIEGAAIGAAVGAAGGALVGAQIEKKQPETAQQAQSANQTAAIQPQAVNPDQMTVQQVADMAGQGVNENVIIDKIKLSNSKFNLNQGQMAYLKERGVSQKVIDAMKS